MAPHTVHPYFDMLADFMVASNFRERFESPLYLLEDEKYPERFSLIPEICRWLEIDRSLIELKARDIVGSDPSGMIEIFENGGGKISYANDLNPCWKRFVIIKELLHLVIEQLNYSDLPKIDVSEMLSSVCRPGASNIVNCYDTNTSNGFAEQSAWLLAEQLIVPWFENEKIITSSKSDYDEAFEYRAPRHIIFSIRQRDVSICKAIESAYDRRKEGVRS